MNAVFVLASCLSHTGLRKSCFRLLRLTRKYASNLVRCGQLGPGEPRGLGQLEVNFNRHIIPTPNTNTGSSLSHWLFEVGNSCSVPAFTWRSVH